MFHIPWHMTRNYNNITVQKEQQMDIRTRNQKQVNVYYLSGTMMMVRIGGEEGEGWELTQESKYVCLTKRKERNHTTYILCDVINVYYSLSKNSFFGYEDTLKNHLIFIFFPWVFLTFRISQMVIWRIPIRVIQITKRITFVPSFKIIPVPSFVGKKEIWR